MATKKLTKKEIEVLKEIQQKNNAIVNEFGNMEIAKMQIEARKAEIVKFYNELKEEEAELGKTLSEKYGVGSINIESGEFIPSEIENTEVASF
jgi:septal ring factor EnvC (AmiA/AmiB activator)